MLHNKRRSAWRRSLLLVLAAMLVMTIAAACGAKKDNEPGGGTEGGKPDSGKAVATYKDGTVTESEFEKYKTFFVLMNPQAEMFLSIPQYQEQFLQEYIGYKVLFSRMSDESKKAADTDTEEFRTQLQTAYDDTEELRTRMESSGLTVDEAVDYFRLIMSVMKDAESKVTDADVKAVYDENPAALQKASVRHVLVSIQEAAEGQEARTEEQALERANEVKGKLDAGGDWQALAAEYSDDPGSKDNGGLYENADVSQWVEEFKNAALTQEVGVIGEPVKTNFGYHVILVEKRDEVTFETLTDEQKEQLRQGAASKVLNDFMQTELPELIEKIDLPQPEATEPPATEGGAENGAQNGDAGTDGADDAPADDTPANDAPADDAPATEEKAPAAQ